MKLKRLYEEITGNVTLYHRLSNKSDTDYETFIKNVVSKGLIPHDNGEIGPVIWFSNDYNDYAKAGQFVVSIEFNQINKEKYEMKYDGHNGYAYKSIPFSDLKIVKIPAIVVRGRPSPSDKVIEFIGSGLITVENINKMKDYVVVYEDAFNKYVQPHIDIPDFVSQLECKKVNVL